MSETESDLDPEPNPEPYREPNPEQDPDIDDQEVLAESPTWRGILRKSDSKINLND